MTKSQPKDESSEFVIHRMSNRQKSTHGDLPTADSKRPPVSSHAQSDTVQDGTMGARSTLHPVPPSEAVSFQPGDLVADRYEIESVLGRGGMGAVYAVNDTTAREPRALKIMAEALARDQKAAERFLSESRVQTLRHPHIVRTIDIGRWAARDLLFITMEKIDARNLRDCLREELETEYAFSVAQSLDICRQVCAALAYAHNSNVIHRDIKPENILIHHNEESDIHIWLMDFGIARLEERTGVTGDQAVLGTFGYMAPEQRGNAREADARCDIFSVGVLLYELLTGSPPDGLEMPSELRGGVTTEIDEIVRRAIARNPDRRFSDAATMQASIERVLKTIGGTSAPVASNADAIPVTELDFGQLVIDLEPRRPPQVSIPGVPDIPEEILELEGQLQSLEQALELLEAETHPALTEHLTALAQLDDRLLVLSGEVTSDRPEALDESTHTALVELLDSDPAIEPVELMDAAPDCPPHLLFTFAETVRNHVQLQSQVKRAREEFDRARDREIKRLQKEQIEQQEKLNELSSADLEHLLNVFIAEHREEELFPLMAWGQFDHEVLSRRRYSMNARDRTIQAQSAFANRQKISLIEAASSGSGGPTLLTAPFGADSISLAIVNWTRHLDCPTEFTNSIGMRFRLIPPGEFLMGSSDGDKDTGRHDHPQHNVRITRPFYLGVYPVTQAQYQQVMRTNPSKFSRVKGENTSRFPVEQVSWDDSQEFLSILMKQGEFGRTYRLPTDAEWEYACRAGTQTAFWSGDALDKAQANYGGALARPSAVGSYPANPFGLYDTHGNIWEWCGDWYGENYYAKSPENDPSGAASGSSRVLRGGSWYKGAASCRCASRSHNNPANRYDCIGFRVLCEL